MTPLMTDILIALSAFAGGVFCGTSLIAPKVYAAVSGTLTQMSHDLNPRRDSESLS